jgi:D-sedoheptulose 7-phosphate isomerase
MKMHALVTDILEESIRVQRRFVRDHLERVVAAADRMASCLASGHKILLFGNGGSAADAQHIAAEFVNRFRIERPPLAALALTTDSSVLTSIGNDYHFDDIFSKQIRALGRRDDIAVGISTSGGSKNVLAAVEAARAIGMFTIGFTGRGGQLAESADLVFSVPSDTTARIQETHALLGHLLCELVDQNLFPGG